ncbi:MAG: hypothetical protein P8046_06545 [Anaerolineales bacterium]
MKRIKQRFQLIRPLLVPLILYIGALAISANSQFADPLTLVNWLVMAIPIIPAIFLALGLIRAINKLDELERKIIFEAASFSFVVTFLILMGLGFFTRANIQSPNPLFISLFMAILLLIGKLLGNRRYR